VTLAEADAAVWRGDAPFDLAVSRFGLMFFEDPDVAFSNIAANLRPGGRLHFACWRAMDENAWVTTPLRAIADLLQKAPKAPQAFSLADADWLRGILGRAGFADLAIDAVDIRVCVAREGGSATASRFLLQFGPAAAALAKTDPDIQALGEERIRLALAEHESNGQVMLGGAIWFVSAIRH
jgi:SAM-dependent methyltransferase